MLSIGKLTGPASARYYTTSVAPGREDYYAGRGEAPGRWTGSAIDLLFEGDRDVSASELAALLQGCAPASGERLRRSGGPHGVSGFDLTFKAPKSVSLVYGIGGPVAGDAARDAHDAAVDQALGYLERAACWTRRGAGGKEHVRGEGFAAAAFRHRTSRAGDPALHTHLVVANLTRADDRWSALDSRHLYRHAKTAGYLYQAALRKELTDRLGVQWTAVSHGTADIVGVPRSVIEHFSRRRAEILEHMAERGEHTARAAHVAALDTRRAKQYDVPVDSLRADWRARAAEHGFGPDELDEVLARTETFPEELLTAAREAVASGELTREHSTFDRRAVLRAWAEQHPAGTSVPALESEADRWLESPGAVAIKRARPGPWEDTFSTPEMLRVEQQLVATSLARRREGVGVADASHLAAVLAERSELGDEQVEMVRALTTSGDGVQIVRAAAGTGKTYALDAARQVWERDGYRVVGCALSARAAVELRDQSGIQATTIARLQLDLRQGHNLRERSVLVVDEAGTVGTRDLEELAQHVREAGAKLVLAGDDRQLPEIEAGGGFRGLARRLGSVELTEVRRQREDWDREALAHLREGRADQWARSYQDHDRLVGAHDAESTRARLVEDWHNATREQPDQDAVMIAQRKSDVADLNDRARRRQRDAGELGDVQIDAAGRAFAEGDRVIACRNDRRAQIANGSRGTVVATDAERRSLSVRFGDSRDVQIDAHYLDEGHLDYGYAMTAHRAQGTTVDQAFVLGSDELYREWGYTALSRHREQARFYITMTESQLSLDANDIAPVDELLALLSRSEAKDMALDRAPDCQAPLDVELDDLAPGP